MKITGNAHIEPFNKNISEYQGCARLEDFKDVLTAGANFARLKHRMMALKVMKMIPGAYCPLHHHHAHAYDDDDGSW